MALAKYGIPVKYGELLSKNSNPTEDDIRDAISGNLCRCQDYNKILDAMLRGAENLRRAANHA